MKIETISKTCGENFYIMLRRVDPVPGFLDIALGFRKIMTMDEPLLDIAPPPPPAADPVAVVQAVLERWPAGPVVLLVPHHPSRYGEYDPREDANRVFRGRDGDITQKLITVLHESIHGSGHARRLSRPSLRDYCRGTEAEEDEEALTYFGAHLAAHRLGIQPLDQGDCDQWQNRLVDLDDESRIKKAVHEASRAVDFILNPAA